MDGTSPLDADAMVGISLDVDGIAGISLDVDDMAGISLDVAGMAGISLDVDGIAADVDGRLIFPEVHGKSTSYIAFGLLGEFNMLLLPLMLLSTLLFILSLTLFLLMDIDACGFRIGIPPFSCLIMPHASCNICCLKEPPNDCCEYP